MKGVTCAPGCNHVFPHCNAEQILQVTPCFQGCNHVLAHWDAIFGQKLRLHPDHTSAYMLTRQQQQHGASDSNDSHVGKTKCRV